MLSTFLRAGEVPGHSVRLPRFLLLPAALAAWVCGCATAEPVLRLTPQASNVIWAGGAAVVGRQGKTVQAAVSFAREQSQKVAFRVEIRNITTTPILIDPIRFWSVACHRAPGSSARACNPSHWATNPERVLLELDINRSREKAEDANDQALMGTLMLLDMTVGMAGVASGKPHLAASALDNAAFDANTLQAMAAGENQQVSAYEMERAMWAAAAFRKTTLLPGQGVAGLVFVDRELDADEVWLNLSVPGETLSFPFNQTLYVASGRR